MVDPEEWLSHTHTYIHTHINTHTSRNTHTHTHTHTHSHIHPHAYTHIFLIKYTDSNKSIERHDQACDILYLLKPVLILLPTSGCRVSASLLHKCRRFWLVLINEFGPYLRSCTDNNGC